MSTSLQQRVQSFASPRRGLAGNACHVHLGTRPSAPAPEGEYHCYAWPSEAGVHEVRCFFGAWSVQCCGHGLLAVAALLFRQGVSVVRLAMNGSLVEAELEQTTDTIWLTFNSHAALRAPHEEPGLQVAQLSALLGVEPHQVSDVALAGAQDGYLVIRLREECDLTAISPPGPRLARITQRALIATSLLDDAGAIGLRYFAPQHGVPEDSATGSAMRVLARYWADRFQDLTATQFSPAGGELFSSLRGATTRIGGRVVTGE